MTGEVSRLVKPPAHVACTQLVLANPFEDQPDHLGLVLDDVVAGEASPIALADVAVAIGRTRQGTHQGLLSGMPPTTPASLKDLGPFILGHHALNLQQQIDFRRHANRANEKDDLRSSPPEFVHENNLVGTAPGQAIGRMDIKPIHHAGGHRVAQALQRGAQHSVATVAVIKEPMLR